MSGNFFTDNPDLQYHLDKVDLREAVAALEADYRSHESFPDAPRNYADAKDNYRLMLELLGEIARPSVRDLKVEFRGLRTARVYPEELPNLPAGTQQILLVTLPASCLLLLCVRHSRPFGQS